MSREMVNSGIPWIGDIPKGWRTGTLLQVLRTHISDGPHETPNLVDNGIPFISVDSLNETENIDFSIVRKFISSEDFQIYSKKTILEKGDVLFTKSATIGKTAIVKDDIFMIWSPIAILKPSNLVNNKFLYHLVSNEYFKEHVCQLSTFNTQFNIGMRTLEKAKICFPSLSEQQKIASFLDRKCSEIDEMIALQEKVVEELKAYKQSVITEAVTKGLNPDVPMKDSGIEWIVGIPEHWKVCRVKDVLEAGKDGIKIGPFGSALTNKVNGDGECKIYGQWNIVNKDFMAGKNYVSAETYRELDAYKIVAGDVLVSMMGTIGKCAIIPNGLQDGIMDSHVIKIRLNQCLINPEFFELAYDKDNSTFVFEQLSRMKKGSIMDGLNSSIVKRLRLLLPPLKEQQEIMSYLLKKRSEIESLISVKLSKIDSLKEYKKSIIYEYVTGKKEVIE